MNKKIIWGVLALVIAVPVVLAANSPYLQWRGPVYIGAGFAGIIALCLLLVQPLLAGNLLLHFSPSKSHRVHQMLGAMLVVMVLLHVVGLWITSPPDVIDVLLLRSPTPFSIWGLIAMYAVFAAGLLAAFRKRLRLRPGVWRIVHLILVAIVLVGTIVHALLIEGAMEVISKTALCAAAVISFGFALLKSRSIRQR